VKTLALSVFALTAGLAGVARADGPETEAPAVTKSTPEPERYPPSSVRLPLILGGIGFSAAAYGASALSAYGWPDAPGVRSLNIPIAGPWLALANNRCPDNEPDCGAILYLRGALEVVSGLAQLGGLGIALEGLVGTTEATADAPTAARVTVMPSLSPSLAALHVQGTF